jgi:hypothetical protein
MTKDLYSDLQSTIQDAYVCVSIYKKYNPQANVYLYQLGTGEFLVLSEH